MLRDWLRYFVGRGDLFRCANFCPFIDGYPTGNGFGFGEYSIVEIELALFL